MKTASAIELKDEERTPCEIWTRVMGYHRPVSAFNPGKKSEHADRVCFEETPQGQVIGSRRQAASRSKNQASNAIS